MTKNENEAGQAMWSEWATDGGQGWFCSEDQAVINAVEVDQQPNGWTIWGGWKQIGSLELKIERDGSVWRRHIFSSG